MQSLEMITYLIFCFLIYFFLLMTIYAISSFRGKKDDLFNNIEKKTLQYATYLNIGMSILVVVFALFSIIEGTLGYKIADYKGIISIVFLSVIVVSSGYLIFKISIKANFLRQEDKK